MLENVFVFCFFFCFFVFFLFFFFWGGGVFFLNDNEYDCGSLSAVYNYVKQNYYIWMVRLRRLKSK